MLNTSGLSDFLVIDTFVLVIYALWASRTDQCLARRLQNGKKAGFRSQDSDSKILRPADAERRTPNAERRHAERRHAASTALAR
jgi:hypothetical protein